MGNTSSDIISRVDALDLEALTKSIGSDLEVASDLRLIFNAAKLTSKGDLDNYSVPGYCKEKRKTAEPTTDQEEAMIYSLDCPENFRDRHVDAIKSLIQEIAKNRPDDQILNSSISKLQGICMTFEALLKLEKFQKLKKAAQEQATAAKTSASSFALEILLDLIKSIDGVNQFYSSVVQKVDKFLSEASPLSFQPGDQNTGKSLDSISKFLQSVLNREIKNVEENDITQGLSALFGLAIATGSLTSALDLALKSLNTDINGFTREQLEAIWKKLKEFKKLKATLIKEPCKFTSPKDASQPISVEDNGLLVRSTQTLSENWPFVLGEKEFTSGVHYFEFFVEEFPSEACLIGVSETNYENSDHQKICYSSNSSISSNNNQIYEWEHFSNGNKIGVLLNMDEKTVTFFKNGVKEPVGNHGPLPDTVRLFVSLGSPIKLRSSEITEYPQDVLDALHLDKAHETSEFRDGKAYKLLESEEVSEDWFSISPAEIGAFIINKLANINTDILSLLEKRDPNAKIPIRKDFTLDYQLLTLDQLDRLLQTLTSSFKSGNYENLSSGSHLQAITSTILLIRTQIFASSHYQDNEVGDEIRDNILNHLKLILSEIPNSKASEEAIKTLSSGFDFFYDEPKERLNYLITGLKEKHGGELTDEVSISLIDSVASEMSAAEKLLPAFESQTEEDFEKIDRFMDLLVTLGAETSTSTLIGGKAPDKTLTGLIEASQSALLTSVVKTNSHQGWLKILLKYSKKLIEASTKLTENLLESYPSGEIPDEISLNAENTIIGCPLEALLYTLPLIKMDLSCNIQILELLQIYLSKANLLKAKPAVLSETVGSKIEFYESNHPYENCLDTTKLVKVPNAIKYVLTFDPQFQTENGCDYLMLWTDENKTTEIKKFTGTDFPREPLEVINPLLFFTFHSDGSVSYWGWKIEIKAVIRASYLAKQWPATTREAGSTLLQSICTNLISGQWDMNAEDEEAVKLLDNPLLKYGIDETSLLSQTNELSEDLKTISRLASPKKEVEDYSDALKNRALISRSAGVSLESYTLSYSQRSEGARFSSVPFLQELIEGSERVKNGWATLKKQSGVVGPSSRIGGEEMDQAERAIFAVYIAFFEVVDTINKIFDESGDLGKTLKYIVKQSNLIRGWAQKHKQKLMDSGKPDITYTDISNDVVTKCTLLLGADYKLALNELGVSKVMKNLLSSVAKVQAKESGGLKAGSKWKSVKEAVHSSSKLKGLVQFSSKASEPENEDVKEFHKVSDLVTKFLETSVPVESIIKVIQGRRGKAITKSAGFQLLSSMITSSSDQEISLIKAFSDSLKVKGEKRHYWEGLEGVDPKLLHIVKHSFFQLYSVLQKEVAKPLPKSVQKADIFYSMFLLEAMSCPFKGIDSHSILEQQFPTVLTQLLRWAKGFINLEDLQRKFTKELCVTKLEIHPEADISEGTDKILLVESSEGVKTYLTLLKDQSLKAIIDVVVTTDQTREGYDKIEGEFVENGETKYFFIKRGEEKSGERCLVDTTSIYDFKYSDYDKLFDTDVDDEIKSRNELKSKFCSTSWALFKQFFYSIAGSWVEPNETKKTLVQDTFMQVLFNDLKYEKSLMNLESGALDIKKLVRGDEWIGKKFESTNLVKNPVQEWLTKFRRETESFENFPLKNLVNEYIEKVDPSMKGVLAEEDLEHIDQQVLETLQSYESNKNYKGYYDFFKYLGNLKDLSNEFPENVQNYLSSSILWKYLPYDFYDAQALCDLSDIKVVIETFASRFRTVEGDSFMKYIELFRSSEHLGIITQDKVPENTPAEFKDKTGSIDFYLLVNTINSNREKFASVYNEIQDSLAMYSEWPSSCKANSEIVTEHADYIGSLLWVVYGCFGSKCLPKLLARESYIKPLIQLTFGVPSEKIITFGGRILRNVVATQHSPDTTINWGQEIFNVFDYFDGYVASILRKIGEGFGWYENENLKKHKLRWIYEGNAMLLSLLQVERWRRSVFKFMAYELESGPSYIPEGYALPPKVIGVVYFLALSSKNFDGFGEEPIVLANAKLSNSSLPKGVIREINGTNATFYSVTEDTSASEPLEKIESIEGQVSLNLFEIFTDEEKDILLQKLIPLWENFQDYEDHIDLSYTKTTYALQRSIYKSIENATIAVVADILESKEPNPELAEKIVERILSRKPLEPKYTSKAMYSNILKQLATKIHTGPHAESKPDAAPLTEESAQARIGSLGEEDQILATELLSLDIPALRIIKCFDAGIKDKEGIINWQEPPKPEKEQTQLYKLALSSSLTTKGNRTSAIYQDEYGNLTIRKTIEGLPEKSEIDVRLESAIFHSLPAYSDSITFLATFEYKPSGDSVNCGIKIGSLELGVKKTDDLYFTINGETTEKLNEAEKLSVKVHAKARGQVYITVEGHTFEKINVSVFNGVKVGNFGIYLEKGATATLLGFEIYEGLYEGPSKTEIQRPKELEGGEQFVKIFDKQSDVTQKQLALIGLTEGFEHNSEGEIDVSASVDKALEQFEGDSALCLYDDKRVINDVKVFDSKDQVPKDYTIAPVYADEYWIDFDFSNIKVLAFSKGIAQEKNTSEIAIEKDPGSYSNVGNLSNEQERPCNIYQKLSQDKPIMDIALFKVTNPYITYLPVGFQLLSDSNGKAINIAPSTEKSYYLFIGIKKASLVMNCSVSSLSSIDSKPPSFGLSDVAANVKPSANKAEDERSYNDNSLLEVHNYLYNVEEFRNFAASKKLLLSTLKKNPSILVNQEKLNKSATFIGNDFKELDSTVSSLLKSSEEFRKTAIKEFVLESVNNLIPKSGGKLNPIMVESLHPYSNCVDIDEVITIPGAKKLKFVFDPQCKVEGCDPLRFYQNSGRNNELKCITGEGEANWQSFEVEGDTVYTWFHSDGSVNYWGYKFDVIPIGGGSSEISAPPAYSAWLLQKLAELLDTDFDLRVLFSSRIIQPLFLRVLSSSTDPQEKMQGLTLLKSLLKVPSSTNYEIVRYLMSEATELYAKCKKTKTTHPFLQTLIPFLSEKTVTLYDGALDKWFVELNELVCYMKGVAAKDEGLNMLIFDAFKSKLEESASITYESAHPYERQTKAEKIHVPLASSLSFQFDKESAVEPRDNIYFSYDPEGNQSACSASGVGTYQFLDNPKGPDIEIRNNGKTVTRTNSSGWGNVWINQAISRGKVKITYKIDCDGGSSCWFIGFVKGPDFARLSLTDVICENFLSNEGSWSWSQSGGFSRPGASSRDERAILYNTNDTISFLVDMDNKTITCFKNDAEVYKFTEVVADSLIPGFCFGGSNQIISIEKVEVYGGLDLSEKSGEFKGDTVYLWHPANVGKLLNHQWSKDLSLKVSDGDKTIAKVDDGASTYSTPHLLKCGKNFIESKINSEGRIGLGFALKSSIDAKTAERSSLLVFSDTDGFTANDNIGVYADFETNECKFYKNGELLSTKEIPKPADEKDSYQYTVVFSGANQSITISETPSIPAGIDLINIHSESNSTLWGYKFKVTPKFVVRNDQDIEALLDNAGDEVKTLWRETYLPKFVQFFKSGAAEQLVIYLDEMTQSKGKDVLNLKDEEIDPTEAELIYYPELEKLSKDDMRQLYRILQSFNQRTKESLGMFDIHFESYETMTEMQKALAGSRNYIFFAMKNNLMKEHLSKTGNGNRQGITVDRPKAARHRDRKDVDALGQFSIFGQIYRNTISWPNTEFRNTERFYQVSYRGEASIDAGGPYNESMSNMCDELQSSYLRLLVPSPNNVHNIGENRESWIVNPSADSQQDIELFTFLGKLMGAAIRTQNNLNLSFPPLFWKRLIMEKLTTKDLRGLDVCIVQILEILRNPEANQLTPDTFSMAYDEKFTTKDSSGREIELIEGGKDIQVTYENAARYADLIEQHRLNENPKAYDAIRKGMSAVIPTDFLNLFSWRQVETLVCGAANIDIDILKTNTDYRDCSTSDQHINYLWETLTEMSPKERTLFLKFVWGRSKLPSGRDWRHMTVTRYNPSGPVNNYMPISHTCFFTMDLPPYTSKDVMKTKLLYAVTHCTDIDLDGTASGGWEEED